MNSNFKLSFISLLATAFFASGCVPLRLIQLEDSKKDDNDKKVQQSGTEPLDCELSGSSYGIVAGSVLGSGNELSSSTVLILNIKDKDSVSICTGTLIDSDKVLSAAHCTSRNNDGTILVAFTNNVECATKAPKRTLRKVTRQAIPSEYSYSSKEFDNSVHDLAVFKFEGTLPAGYKVRNLPFASFTIQNDDTLVMTGYGVTEEDGKDSGTLRFTTSSAKNVVQEFPIIDRKDRTVSKMATVPRTVIVQQPSNGVCSGDSGGPLYVKTDSELMLVGITSVGVDNLGKGSIWRSQVCHGVAIFADVRQHLSWIYQQINSL